MKDYKIVNDEVVQLVEGPYEGVTFKYGKVQLIPNEVDDNLTISFEYDLLDGQPTNVQQFEQYIGQLLHEMIEEMVAENKIVYTGGT